MTSIKTFIKTLSILLFAIAMAGCSQESGSQPAATAAVPAPAATPPEATTPAADEQPQADTTVSELTGTSWQLVIINWMDDSTAEPADRSLYTLAFNSDGQVAMRADCNRGMGSWSSESPGQVQFGPIAATRAMCPPESLSDKYLAQFEWVRSYVLKDGHLFLATMADGAIIEFEPFTPATDGS